MNPLTQFESAAHEVWQSPASMEDKAKKFLGISQAVEHYLQRLDEAQNTQKADAWGQAMYARVKDYLNRLAADLKWLAHNCQATCGSMENLAGRQPTES